MRNLNTTEETNRRDNIKICGIEQKDDESTDDIVKKVAEFIGEPIEPSDISHRLPPRNTENATETVTKHPAIIW